MKTNELYKFTQDTQIWTYTSGDSETVYNSETYTPVSMGRNNIESKNELSKANLEIKLDQSSALAQYLLTAYLEQIVSLTLFTQEDGSTQVAWKGRLANVKPGTATMTLTFESIFTSLRRPGLRARYQRPCRHVLYGRGCTLDKDNFAIPGSVDSVSGAVVQVPEAAAYADGYFNAGMIQAADGTYRFILNHSGAALTLVRPFEYLIEARASSGWGRNWGGQYGGTAVTLYPGCDRQKTTCINKFNNLANFGGFPYIPIKNPFGGSSIA